MMRSSSPESERYHARHRAEHEAQTNERERFIDDEMETLLTESAHYLNEGNNGVIFKVSAEDISPTLQAAVREQDGVTFDGDSVIKTLKLYKPGTALHEFTMQKKAYDILAQANRGQPMARVPKPILERELTLSLKTKKLLEKAGIETPQDKAEMIIMDFVPGVDIATLLYREVLERHPESRAEHRPELLSFDSLQREVIRVLGLITPSAQQRLNDPFAEQKIFSENASTIFTYLKKSGFALHPTILEQVRNALKVLHAHGFYFRDGHLRNFMVVGPHTMERARSTGAEPQTYLIDYGHSIHAPDQSPDDVYEEIVFGMTRRYPRDESAVETLSLLTHEQETPNLMANAQKLRARIQSNPKALEKYEAVLNLRGLSLPMLFQRSMQAPQKTEMFAALILGGLERNLFTLSDVEVFIRTSIDTAPLPERSKLLEVLAWLPTQH